MGANGQWQEHYAHKRQQKNQDRCIDCNAFGAINLCYFYYGHKLGAIITKKEPRWVSSIVLGHWDEKNT